MGTRIPYPEEVKWKAVKMKQETVRYFSKGNNEYTGHQK